MWGRGTVLGDRYTLAERIGGGGMGEVWRADDGVLRRQVAVKVLLPALLDDIGFAARFRREAMVLASLSHPGIVDVHDYGESRIESGEMVAYIVMELVEGRPLNEVRAQSGPLPAEQVLDIAGQALDALHAAHLRGVTHRDIKPSNLMLGDDGRVTVTDFGIARSSAASIGITDSHAVLGTALYMAPEQAEGLGAVAASDLYSTGVVCYELLTGEPPFTGESVIEIALKHIREPVPALPEEFPAPVRAFVARALAKQPQERYADASVMAAAARRAAAGRPLGELDAPAGPTVPRPDGAALPAVAVAPTAADGSRRNRLKWLKWLSVPAGIAVPLAVTVTLTVTVAVTVLYIDPRGRQSDAPTAGREPSASVSAPVSGSGSQSPGASPSGTPGEVTPGASAPPPGGDPGGQGGAGGAVPPAAPNPAQGAGGAGAGGRTSTGPGAGGAGAGGAGTPGGSSTPGGSGNGGGGSANGGSTPPQGCGGASWGAITNVGNGLKIGLGTSSPQGGAKVVTGGTTAFGWVHEEGNYDSIKACSSSGAAMSRALTQFGDTVRVELAGQFSGDVWWNLEKAPTSGAYFIKDISFQGGCLTSNGAGAQLTVVACDSGKAQQWRMP